MNIDYNEYDEMKDENRQLRILIDSKIKEVLKLKRKLNEIKRIATNNIQENQCNSCDGVGIPDCLSTSCATFQMNHILQLLEEEE